MLKRIRSWLSPYELRRRFSERRVHRLSAGQCEGLRFSTGPAEDEYATGDNEVPVQDCMADFLRDGMVVYDVGANVGFMSVLCAKLVGPSGRVYAFEPVESNIPWIARNVRVNRFDNVVIVQKAVSNEVGKAELNLAQYSGGAALASVEPPPDFSGTAMVDVTTIDAVVGAGEAAPDLVKIDVEGAEILVLEGMSETIEAHGPAILYEIDGATEQDLKEKAGPIEAFLRARGYRISKLDDAYPDNDWCVHHYIARR